MAKRLSFSDFVDRTQKLYGDSYDYSKVNFINTSTKVCITCSKHGDFWITPNNFLNGHKCPTCSGRQRITKEVFISRSTAIHKGRYDYSKVEWNGANKEVCIICPVHGEFWQIAKYHFIGNGCQKCFACPKSTTEEFIKKAKAIYGDRYDYSKVEYKGNKEKVCIICGEHGEFWQTPNNHLLGAGCPTCPQSNLEGEIRHFLIKNNIKFEQEKTFDWLVFNRKMFLDFFLPEYGVAIECQGGQHFSPTELFGGKDFYQLTIERDKAKKDLCEKHGINVLYYSNAHIDYPYPVFESVRLLLKAIKQHGIVDEQQWKEHPELPFEEF
ncbi:hypothetical protein IJ556_00440 [bacterium]|nr:hypothetical protein [Treponema sp.]MBR1372903.1 hypothetical protein [bacterium]